jgi:nucleotide-binding universal stress UspA family protein
MFDRILFPTDGGAAASAALPYALDVASAHDATVHLLYVADTNRDSVTAVGDEVVDVLETDGEAVVSDAADRARARGVDAVAEVLQGDPSSTVVDYADQVGVDLIVMPTRGRSGIERVLLGSVTERVMEGAAAPVVAVPPVDDEDGADAYDHDYPPATILVPTDGSPGADLAVDLAIEFATATGAALRVLSVVESGALGFGDDGAGDDEASTGAASVVEAATERARAAGVDDVAGSVAHGRVYREIRGYAVDEGVDLVAMGTRGVTDFEFDRYLLGGVAAKFVRTSPMPVVTVRATDGDDATED